MAATVKCACELRSEEGSEDLGKHSLIEDQESIRRLPAGVQTPVTMLGTTCGSRPRSFLATM